MHSHRFRIQVGEESLAAVIWSAEEGEAAKKPSIVALHGAGVSHKERFSVLAKFLVEKGDSVLGIDFSGHGGSSGSLKESSLKKRVEEAVSSIRQFASQGPLIIFGSSMGGYVALKMLEHFEVKALVLFCPALYDRKAFEFPFDQGFSELIRQPLSWANTDGIDPLKNFFNKLLIVIGEMDTVIPSGVIDLIFESAREASEKKIIRIPECTHQIKTWLESHPQQKERVYREILKFLDLK